MLKPCGSSFNDRERLKDWYLIHANDGTIKRGNPKNQTCLIKKKHEDDRHAFQADCWD